MKQRKRLTKADREWIVSGQPWDGSWLHLMYDKPEALGMVARALNSIRKRRPARRPRR